MGAGAEKGVLCLCISILRWRWQGKKMMMGKSSRHTEGLRGAAAKHSTEKVPGGDGGAALSECPPGPPRTILDASEKQVPFEEKNV